MTALVMTSVAYGQSNAGDIGSAQEAQPAAEAPQTFGDSGADLVYTPVTPCRIINTIAAGGPIAGGATRSFKVAGSGFAGQGGVAGSCGVPVGATGAVINFVAVGPTGAGDLRITPFGTPMPTASFLNYVNSGIPNDNTANGMTFPICNPATATCTNDITIQADVSSTNVVADVLGYFKAPAGYAYASVQRSPAVALELARTKNFTAVTRPSTGVYCLTPAAGVSLATVPVMVTVEWGNSLGFDLLAYPLGAIFNCTAGQLEVRTYQLPSGVATLSNNVSFYVLVP
jgi:hypothetical protein